MLRPSDCSSWFSHASQAWSVYSLWSACELSPEASQRLPARRLETNGRIISYQRPYISDSATAHLVASLILSRIDYYNATLAGLLSASIKRLQKIRMVRSEGHSLAQEWAHHLFWNSFTGFQSRQESSARLPLWHSVILKERFLSICHLSFMPINAPFDLAKSTGNTNFRYQTPNTIHI